MQTLNLALSQSKLDLNIVASVCVCEGVLCVSLACSFPIEIICLRRIEMGSFPMLKLQNQEQNVFIYQPERT